MVGKVGSVYGLFTPNVVATSQQLKSIQDETIALTQQFRTSGRLGKYSDPAVKNVSDMLASESRVKSLATAGQDVANLSQRQVFVSNQILEAQTVNDELVALLGQIKSPTPPLVDEFNKRIQSLFDGMTVALNRRYLGKNSFNGPREDGDAVVDLKTLTSLPSGSPLPSPIPYIAWEELPNAPVQLDSLGDVNTINRFAVDATHLSFQKTICALRMCLNANPRDPNDPAASSAFDMAQSANDDYNQALILSAINEEILTESIDIIEDQQADNDVLLARLTGEQTLPTIFHQLKMLEITDRVTEYVATHQIREMMKYLDRV